MKQFVAAIFIVLFAAVMAWGAEGKPVKPSPKDKCPVCGMFVLKYPDFAAQVIFKDGFYAAFDGTKDMFKYVLNLKKYAPGRTAGEIAAIHVTDYYSLEFIDGSAAWYVGGSDILGPMGKELIPFAKEAEARGFMKDHMGQSLLRFKDIGPDLIQGLD